MSLACDCLLLRTISIARLTAATSSWEAVTIVVAGCGTLCTCIGADVSEGSGAVAIAAPAPSFRGSAGCKAAATGGAKPAADRPPPDAGRAIGSGTAAVLPVVDFAGAGFDFS